MAVVLVAYERTRQTNAILVQGSWRSHGWPRPRRGRAVASRRAHGHRGQHRGLRAHGQQAEGEAEH
eukprot:1096050-Pyramimonas_sp.AAC.1